MRFTISETLGDNPGIYELVAQTQWWPFIPAVGVAVGVCLVVVFVVTTIMALKREASPSWAAASGVVAAVVLGVSVIGCVVAAAQYDDRDQQHRARYVAAVTEWLS